MVFFIVVIMEESGERVLFVTVESNLRDWVVVIVEGDYFLAHAFVVSDVKFLAEVLVLVVHKIGFSKHPTLGKSPTYLDAQLVDLVNSENEFVLLLARTACCVQLENATVREGSTEFSLIHQLDFRFLLRFLPAIKSVAGFFL